MIISQLLLKSLFIPGIDFSLSPITPAFSLSPSSHHFEDQGMTGVEIRRFFLRTFSLDSYTMETGKLLLPWAPPPGSGEKEERKGMTGKNMGTVAGNWEVNLIILYPSQWHHHPLSCSRQTPVRTSLTLPSCPSMPTANDPGHDNLLPRLLYRS